MDVQLLMQSDLSVDQAHDRTNPSVGHVSACAVPLHDTIGARAADDIVLRCRCHLSANSVPNTDEKQFLLGDLLLSSDRCHVSFLFD
jgi:hypothetical protein